MSINPLGPKSMSPVGLRTTQTEKKALPMNPFQQPSLRDPSLTADSFATGGWVRPGISGYAGPSEDVFQSTTQTSGARAVVDLLGGIGETFTGFADLLKDEFSADGPADELSAYEIEDEYFADGPADELSADAPEDAKTEELPPDPPPMTADGRVIPQANDKRPEGDDRSAEQIVNDSSPLANLGRQKDIKFKELCQQTGVNSDLDVRDAKQDPDAVYRLSKVLEFIDASPDCEGNDRPGKVKDGKGDGNIEGITSKGDARHGTEAGMVKDFAEQGYDFLQSQATLPTTNDPWVYADGSNKDEFHGFLSDQAENFSFVPGISNVMSEVGDSKGVGGAIAGAVGGSVRTLKDGFEGVLEGVGRGEVDPFQMGLNAYRSELEGGKETPEFVKEFLDTLP